MPFVITHKSPFLSLRSRAIILFAGLILVLFCCDIEAQSFERKNDRNTFIRNIQFNFNIPSARAIGLGGFLGYRF